MTNDDSSKIQALEQEVALLKEAVGLLASADKLAVLTALHVSTGDTDDGVEYSDRMLELHRLILEKIGVPEDGVTPEEEKTVDG